MRGGFFGTVRLGAAIAAGLACAAGDAGAAATIRQAQSKIAHVIVIMQENRSFDTYFGAFPGADGFSTQTCYPLKKNEGCVMPFHDRHDINAGGGHNWPQSVASIDNGRMDGFAISQQETGNRCGGSMAENLVFCPALLAGLARHDAVGYHTADEIPNYWAYASAFVLQDHLFESAEDYSLIAHLYLVSAWTAKCANLRDPMSCVSSFNVTASGITHHDFAWSSLADLLDAAGVSWKYYINEGALLDCQEGEFTCPPNEGGAPVKNNNLWSPLPGFTTVQQKEQAMPGYIAAHIPSLSQFYTDLYGGALPAVSWVMPDNLTSEHPPRGVQEGMEYVTAVVNAVMQSPYWNSTAIFVTWDDWGGFFDHEPPPVADYVNVGGKHDIPLGYGIRVPGLIISPWVVPQVDHQVVSHDAYLKFIEDVFLSSARVGAPGTVRPDSRTTIRESLTQVTGENGQPVAVGDLMNDFNFQQTPIPPLVMSTLIPAGFAGVLDKAGNYHFPLTWNAVTTGPVMGYNVKRTTTSGSGYTPVPGCSGQPGAPFTGRSCTDRTAVRGVAYHYIITAVAPDGMESPNSGEMDITP